MVYPTEYQMTTKRLKLRPIQTGDEVGLWPHVSDSRLTTFLAWEPHTNLAQTKLMVDALVQSQAQYAGFHWLVCTGADVVGLVSLIDVRWTHRSWTINRAELAYWIGVPFQSKGYATEASRAVVGFAYERLGLHKIRVYHAADNPASEKTVEKLNFRLVGEERDAFQKNGCWHHLRHYERVVSEWTSIEGVVK